MSENKKDFTDHEIEEVEKIEEKSEQEEKQLRVQEWGAENHNSM